MNQTYDRSDSGHSSPFPEGAAENFIKPWTLININNDLILGTSGTVDCSLITYNSTINVAFGFLH